MGFTVFVTALFVSLAALASEKQHTHIEIAVDDNASEPTSFQFDSVDAGFDLSDLQVGESRAFDDAAGGTALVTRTERGYKFDVDGREIEIGDLDDHHAHSMSHPTADEDIHVIKKIRRVQIVGDDTDSGVTIVTVRPLDEATKQQIRDVLSASGDGDNVRFIDGHRDELADDMHLDHDMHVVIKEVDVTN